MLSFCVRISPPGKEVRNNPDRNTRLATLGRLIFADQRSPHVKVFRRGGPLSKSERHPQKGMAHRVTGDPPAAARIPVPIVLFLSFPPSSSS
ncbi:hypothetical protein BOX24_00020 [Leptospirillum ferriphilum]|uniref:Uncharacterized protein n=2 Tax=Leptospirillum ferriphilum TaxID=178606 RepID=A0A1V3SYI2_9BACT|nr:hypothetical protein LFML04_0316 [Leptospirillum ferriphilum ML-04]OOH75242.1 hypothetical protein BOX24_00020 [Leptospirillum ferriphilum]